MASTVISTSDNTAVKLWSDSLYRESLVEPFFSKFVGGSSSIINMKSDFESQKGDRIRFALRKKLTGSGVNEGETLRGKEESLASSTFDLELAMYRHAVSFDTGLSIQRNQFSIPAEAQMAIKDWSIEKIDDIMFSSLYSAPTNILYSGTANSDATVSAKLTLAQISKAKAIAMTGNHREFNPLKTVKVMGGDYLVLVVHPDAIYDLKVNDSAWAQAQRDAQARSASNPVFTGAVGVWDNVIILESERVPYELVGSTLVTKSYLLGQQSLVVGYGQKPKFVEETFDYGIEKGIAVELTLAAAKPKFDAKDFGSVQLVSAMTDISL